MKKLNIFLFVILNIFILSSCKRVYKTVNFGKQYDENMSWIVVDEDEKHMTLLSEKVIDVKKYDEYDERATFNSSTLNDYLNSEFIDEYFTRSEMEKLVFLDEDGKTFVTIPSIEILKKLYGYIDNIDPAFYNDVNYFEANENVIAYPMDVAIYNEIYPYNNEDYAEIMRTKVDKRYDFADGAVNYWVLDKDLKTGFPYYITPTGYLDVVEADTDYIGYRAIIKIKK